VPKFELYKHNDEPFNMFTGFFYELWTFAYFDRLCKLEKGGMKFKKNLLLWNTEPISTKLCWNDSWVVLFQNCVRHFRTPTKMAAIAELNLTLDPMGNSHKIFLSETICSIRTKFWWNSHWMVLFQKCVRRFGPSINFFFNFNTFRVTFQKL
jgi:hypothetical protein